MTIEEFESIKEKPKLIQGERRSQLSFGLTFIAFYRIISMGRKSGQIHSGGPIHYEATRHIYISIINQSEITFANVEKRSENYTEADIKRMTIIKSLPEKVSLSLFRFIFEE